VAARILVPASLTSERSAANALSIAGDNLCSGGDAGPVQVILEAPGDAGRARTTPDEAVSDGHRLEVSALLKGLLADGPEDRIDVGNIGDPRGMDRNRQPGRAGNDSKNDKRVQSVRERQARDKPQAVHPALTRKDHD